MNSLIQLKPTTLSFVAAFGLTCFGIVPGVQAVMPPPDGCYPNFTTAEGCDALNMLTSGAGNTGLGWRSLFSDSTGSFNTGVGGGALALNNGDSNTAVGAAALLLNTTGNDNVAVGTDALVHNDGGIENTANGALALFSNTQSSFNTAIGWSTLSSNTTGGGNTALGRAALSHNTAGSQNIAVGATAGLNLTTGDHNIDIGNLGVAGESDTIRIGTSQNRTFIAGIRGIEPPTGVLLQVLVDLNGQLGTVVSSRRFKHEIKPMSKASESILALEPVTFRYKSDTTGTPQFGLIAEEVEKVNPDLVVRDQKGETYTVRYDAVNVMLLNEFLKEHHKVERLEKQVAALTVGLQKVRAQLELNQPAPQTVTNDQ